MATRPSLNIAVPGTKNQASKYNENFDMIMDFVDDSIDEAKNYVDDYMPEIDASTDGKILTNNGSVASWSTFSTFLQAVYPVGSIFIGTTAGCPLATFFGTWEKVAANRCLQGSSSSHAANTTIAAGLPNITGDTGIAIRGFSASGAFYKSSSGNVGSSGGTDQSVAFSAARSNSIYGNSSTVQPPAYVVNVWRRTA